jgi:hypothetical protein
MIMKTGKMFAQLLAGFVAFGVVVLSAGESRAETSHDYHHGSACRAENPSAAVKYDRWGIYNDSASSAWVYCDLGFNSGSSTMQFYATVWDAAASSKIQCTYYVTNADGSQKWASSPLHSATNDNSRSETLSVVTPIVQGYAYVRCTLPPKDSYGNSYISSVHRASF